MKTILTIAATLATTVLLAQKQPLERYQSIIDRHPFGMPPPGFDPTVDPSQAVVRGGPDEAERTAEQAQLAAAIRLSAIIVSPDGTATVGFSDVSDPKAPKNYCLKKGETQNSWTVKEIDPVKETMTVEREGIEVTLKCGESSGGKDAKGKGARPGGLLPMAGGLRPLGGRSPLLGGRPSPLAPPAGGGALATLRERRALREQQRQALLDQAEKDRVAQERRAAEEKAAREAEREEQRRALDAIREELKRSRDERERQQREAANQPAPNNDGANAGAHDNP